MPTVLIIFNLKFIIHTRDHGFPHVTVYLGNPKDHEAMAKIRLDEIRIMETEGFSSKDLAKILAITQRYQEQWLEEWNETREG